MSATPVRRLAWRLLRGGRRQAVAVGLLIAAAVAVTVALDSFLRQCDRALLAQGQSLLLADLEIQGREPLDDAQLAELAEILPPGSQQQRLIVTQTMASRAGGETAQLVRLLAVDPTRFPWYGRLRLGGVALAELADDDAAGVVVQPDLLEGLGLQVGDELLLGRKPFRIRGVIEELPGLGLGGFAIGPRVLVGLADLQATGLLQHGSRSRHRLSVRLPDPQRADELVDRLIARWQLADDARERLGGRDDRSRELMVRSHRDASTRVRRVFDSLGAFLRLAAVVVTGLAAAAIWAAVRGLADSQGPALQLVRVLGAGRALATRLQLLQVLLVAGGGSLLGLAGGWLASLLLQASLRQILPLAPVWWPAGWSLAKGLWLGLGLGLAITWLVQRLEGGQRVWDLLRQDGGSPAWRPAAWPLAAIVAVLVGAVAGPGGPAWTAIGATVVAVPLILLALVALLVAGLRLLGPAAPRRPVARWVAAWLRWRPWAAAWSQAPLVLALIGLHGLLGYRAGLQADLDLGPQSDLPKLFAIEVFDEDRAILAERVRRHWQGRYQDAPVVRLRLRSINGAGLDAQVRDQAQLRRRQREWSVSWRAEPGVDEEVVAGEWMAVPGVAEVSLEEEFAERVGLGIGDELVFSLFGAERPMRVTSLRRVDWSRFAPNFRVLVEAGALADDPRSWVASIGLPPGQPAGPVQADLAERLPGVSVFDIEEVVERVVGLIGIAEGAIAALALVVAVLAVLLLALVRLRAMQARRDEGALLRLLGASRAQVARAVWWEALLRGGLVGLLALALGLPAGAWLAQTVTERATPIPWAEQLLLAAGGWLVTALLAWWSSRQLVRRPPQVVVRQGD